jgi:hypothetical protein
MAEPLGKKSRSGSEDETLQAAHHEDRSIGLPTGKRHAAAADHPLAGLSHAQLAAMGEKYAREHQGLTDEEEIRAFRLGAIIAGDMDADDSPVSLRDKYAAVQGLSEDERSGLVNEVEKKWNHPGMLYYLVTSTSPSPFPFSTRLEVFPA